MRRLRAVRRLAAKLKAAARRRRVLLALAEPYVIDRVTDVSGVDLYGAPRSARAIGSTALRSILERLRGVVRLPDGTAHSLDARDFPIPVMGKTGTTSDFRDARVHVSPPM